MSRATRITDLSERYRRNVLRQQSRDLGRGNGDTVSATPVVPPPVIATYYQTNEREDWIRPVHVTRETPLYIDILTETGAVRPTLRTAPGEHYHATREEARAAVQRRLRQDVLTAEDRFAAFMDREFPQTDS